ncbi:MAG: T9SS type A sorting domain-containing protein [Chitinispirillales bacterium]|jgi:hypothetical protein|nr:T9SS type A sorting domain-containing protein [Chitinispirillales bacterium]
MKLKANIAVFCVMLIPVLAGAEVLLKADFNNHSEGQYTRAMATSDFPYPGYTWFSNNLEAGRGEIVTGKEGAGNALRLLYPAGEIGSASTVQIRAALSKAVDTAWASYWVKFDDPFDFVRGGKLPGLCGGQCITGGNNADGYNGWSARVMWRPAGVAVQYMYYLTNTGYGEDLVFNKSAPKKLFTPGKWHRLNTQIIMNTPQAADGTIRSWFDGELAMERTNIIIRNIDTLKTNLFYISTFFGGSDLTWAPPENTYITFDDFLVISEPVSSPYPQTLYNLSATSGRVPFTVSTDGSASLGTNLEHTINFGNGTVTAGPKASVVYSKPGIYNFTYSVNNNRGESIVGRNVFALDTFDLMCDSAWQSMALRDTMKSTTDTLRMYLTILDTTARILVGLSTNAEPTHESHFYGILKYENGGFSAIDGNINGNYVDAAEPIEAGAGTYRITFVCDFSPPSNDRTYSVWVNDAVVGENLRRRGFASSVSTYGTWASKDQAAILHIDEWERHISISKPNRQTPSTVKKLPKVAPRKNGILFGASAQASEIEMYNARGILIKRVTANAKKESFVPVKSKGVYLYRIKTGGEVYRGSAVVK